jgi:hypothetical protein
MHVADASPPPPSPPPPPPPPSTIHRARRFETIPIPDHKCAPFFEPHSGCVCPMRGSPSSWICENGYTENEVVSIPTYKYWDTITIDSIDYLRFALKLSNGKLNGLYYNKKGNIIKPITFSTTIYDVFIEKIFGISTTQVLNPNILIGRALLFRWIFDRDNGIYVNYETETINTKKKSILNILSWPIANKTFEDICIIQNQGFAFVQNNINGLIIKSNVFYGLPDLAKQELLSKSINYPQQLNIQYQNGEYFFTTEGYIYITLNYVMLDINYKK